MVKIAVAVMTLLVNVSAGVVVFVMMLVGMNGFSESDANWGIGAYIVSAAAVTIAMVAGALLAVRILDSRGWNLWGAATLGTLIFSALGAVLKGVCGIIGVLVADLVRVNF